MKGALQFYETFMWNGDSIPPTTENLSEIQKFISSDLPKNKTQKQKKKQRIEPKVQTSYQIQKRKGKNLWIPDRRHETNGF